MGHIYPFINLSQTKISKPFFSSKIIGRRGGGGVEDKQTTVILLNNKKLQESILFLKPKQTKDKPTRTCAEILVNRQTFQHL